MSKKTPEEISGSELEKIFADAIIPPSTRSRRNVKIVAKEAVLFVDGKEVNIQNIIAQHLDFGTAERIVPQKLQSLCFTVEDEAKINEIWAGLPPMNLQIEKAHLFRNARPAICKSRQLGRNVIRTPPKQES